MKLSAATTLASALLLTACASVFDGNADAPSPLGSDAHTYHCKSGERIDAVYPADNAATILYKGERHTMEIAVSASGARYLGDEYMWWTKSTEKGAQAILLPSSADNSSGEILERCTEY